MKRVLATLMLLAAGLVLVVGHPAKSAEPDNNRPLRIGLVSVMRIMTEMPEYKQYSEKYLQERKELFDAKGSKNYQQVIEARKQKILDTAARWQKIKEEFVLKSMEKIKTASEQVMKDKNLTFVLMDAPWYPGYPLRQYGAEDITTDVLFALKGK